MPYRTLTAVLHALLCLLLTWSACAFATGFEVTPWPAQKPIPTLNVADLHNQRWTLAALKGRVVVLNFWATWCEPCRAEMPSLARFAESTPREQLVVLAVNYQEHDTKVRRFIDAELLELPPASSGIAVVLDGDGSITKDWTRRMFPTTVIIDTTGKPRFVVTGEYDWTSPEARKLLAPLLPAPNFSRKNECLHSTVANC